MEMIWLIEFLVLLMTPILIYHALKSKNLDFVKVFWLSGMLMGILRELVMVPIAGLYEYGGFHLTIFGFPIIYAVLWTNLCYVGWEWSNNYLGVDYLKSKPWDQHLPLMFATLVMIAFFFETLLSLHQLIHWKLDTIKTFWGGVPILAPFAYGFTVVLFMKSLKWISLKPQQNWQSVTLKLAAIQPVVVLSLMGLLFILDLVIILVFS
ncbi:hypothetical protein HQ531_06780, partial [bacterium]|nr:hypothetical protein [bacterium]